MRESEVKLYPKICNLLSRRGIEILQNEVEFLHQLKKIDLFAYDLRYYYAIEVKAECTKKEDFYNLKYIIENNQLDKPIKGLLFGTKKIVNTALYNKIKNEYNIEYIALECEENKKSLFTKNMKHHFNIYEKSSKFIRTIFKDVSDCNILNLVVHRTFGVKVVYQLSHTKQFIFRANNPDWNNEKSYKNKELYGYMYIIEKDSMLDIDNILIKKRISQRSIRREFYKEKEKLIENKGVNLSDVGNICTSMHIQLKFLSFEDIVENISTEIGGTYLYFEISKNSGFAFYKIGRNNLTWISAKYAYIFCLDIFEQNLKYKDKIIINLYREYNEINYLEAINITINNKLFEPMKHLIFKQPQSILILEIKLKNNKKTKTIKEEYLVDTYNYISDPNFYLMCDVDIIINFEKKVTNIIKNGKFEIIEEDNDLYNYLRDRTLKKLGEIKTLKQLIKEDNKD
ncbi:hypothetical protein FC777_02265 [Clostridium botulinum]|nr:hypothetical protein [Clostridium botulinum]